MRALLHSRLRPITQLRAHHRRHVHETAARVPLRGRIRATRELFEPLVSAAVVEQRARPKRILAEVLERAAREAQRRLVGGLEALEECAVGAELQHHPLRQHGLRVDRVAREVAQHQQRLLPHLLVLVEKDVAEHAQASPIVGAQHLAERDAVVAVAGLAQVEQHQECPAPDV